VLSPVLRALNHPDPEITAMPAASRALGMVESLPARVPASAVAYEYHSTRLPSMTPSHGAWRNLHF
jgi:hypothetical protein